MKAIVAYSRRIHAAELEDIWTQKPRIFRLIYVLEHLWNVGIYNLILHCYDSDARWYVRSNPGTDVMIFKIFSPKTTASF
jgi:hypothetical protein